MIPSRGLRWSALKIGSIGRRRTDLLSARSFSSTPLNGSSTPLALSFRANAFGRSPSLRPKISTAVTALRYGPSSRFQSTSVDVSSAKETITTHLDNTTLAQGSTAPGSLDGAFDLTSLDLNSMTEQIGYLKAIGLNYGYGPTGFVEWILEHVHVFAGTPWWASIALTAVLIRLACLYPNILGTDNAAKMAMVAPYTKPLMDRMRDSSRVGDTAQTMQIRAELQRMNRRAGVKYWKAALPLIQAPIGFGTFFLLRAMANLPVPGLETGGLLWFSNLTIPDPYFVLPLATAGVLHWVLRTGGETGVQTISPELLRMMSYGLPAITLALTAFFPSALQLSFFVTGVLSYLQAVLFRWAPFRKYMNMTAIPTRRADPFASTPAAEPPPYQPRIVIAPARAPPSATSTYEPPRSASRPAPATPIEKATLLSGLTREVSSSISAVQESARKTLKSAREMTGQESKDGKRTKRQLQQANEYERKRRLEEAKRREEINSERRARKEARRREMNE